MQEKILVVDDQIGIRFLLTEELSENDFEVHSCASGEEALKDFSKFQPDAVITDFKMEKINGLELAKEIKKENPKTTVILMSGDLPNKTNPADKAIEKPFRLAFLVDMLKNK